MSCFPSLGCKRRERLISDPLSAPSYSSELLRFPLSSEISRLRVQSECQFDLVSALRCMCKCIVHVCSFQVRFTTTAHFFELKLTQTPLDGNLVHVFLQDLQGFSPSCPSLQSMSPVCTQRAQLLRSPPSQCSVPSASSVLSTPCS